MNAFEIILFYFLQTTDYATTAHALLRYPQRAKELNPLFSFSYEKGNIIIMGVLKYLLATAIVVYVYVFPPLSYLLIFDMVWETGVSLNNSIQLLRIKSSSS